MTRRLLAALVALVALALVSAGCSTTLGDLPLPGTGVSGDTITVHADFANAANLAQGAEVKVNGVDSGKVQTISTKDFKAQVTMVVKTDADLRQGAQAQLRYTTPLGELYVDVTNPTSGTKLADGDSIGRTSTAPTVEDALQDASMLINGGGLGDLQTITEELNTALDHRQGTVRQLLQRTTDLLTQANATTGDIDRTLHALDDVSLTLGRRQALINRALKEIRPAAAVLQKNTPGLTRLLATIKHFSGTASHTVDVTGDRLVRVLQRAEPVLAQFASNGGRYPASLDGLIRLANLLDQKVPGDYLNISLAAHLDKLTVPALSNLLDALGLHLPVLGRHSRLARHGDQAGLSGMAQHESGDRGGRR